MSGQQKKINVPIKNLVLVKPNLDFLNSSYFFPLIDPG
jgi:hypothetical protein